MRIFFLFLHHTLNWRTISRLVASRRGYEIVQPLEVYRGELVNYHRGLYHTLSERFGKVLQKRQSISINRNDVSTSFNTQMDSLIPASKISTLTQGMFVGAVCDNFNRLRLPIVTLQLAEILKAETHGNLVASRRGYEIVQPLEVYRGEAYPRNP